MRPETLIPLLIGCAMLWWLGRGMRTTTRLTVATVTLLIIAAVLLFERGIQQ